MREEEKYRKSCIKSMREKRREETLGNVEIS
jgi:hypothetical protein